MKNDDRVKTGNIYKYTRLYDHCISDDSKTGGRYFARRRNRVKTTIILAFLHIILIVLSYSFVESEFKIYLSVILLFSLFLNLSFGRLDPFSLLNLFSVKNIEKKEKRNCFENLILQSNLENKFLNSSHENFHRVKEHYNWLHITLIYKDKMDYNLYLFKIYPDKVVFKIRTSKKFRKEYPKNVNSALGIRQVLNVNDFTGCESALDLQKRITEVYIQKRNELYKNIQ